MPITPFHFGPGAALNSLAPKSISFVSFAAANVLIDLEPLYYMISQQYPLHRFFHTYVGATLVGICAIFIISALSVASKKLAPPIFKAFFSSSIRATVIGAFLGAYSHIILDSVMHSDIRPLSPFSQSNILHGVVSLSSLHWFCIYSALFGIAALGVRYATKTAR